MIKMAVVRWYLLALYRRCERVMDRVLGRRPDPEAQARLARAHFAQYAGLAAPASDSAPVSSAEVAGSADMAGSADAAGGRHATEDWEVADAVAEPGPGRTAGSADAARGAESRRSAGETDPLRYAEMLRRREFKASSQNGEDGLVAFILSEVGVTNRRFVEFGVGDGRECNTANLAIRFGWSGLMIEGSAKAARRARDYYASLGLGPGAGGGVRVVQAFLTTANLNDTIGGGGMRGEIDLLSLDVDGNDYWLWEALDVVDPRVAVVEYNAAFGLRSITVPYDPAFYLWRKHRSGWYAGASLPALAKLGRQKGYALVSTDSSGVNAFFVRQDVLRGRLREIDAEEAYRPQTRTAPIATVEQQFDAIRHLGFVEV